jgi:hypothetical protein
LEPLNNIAPTSNHWKISAIEAQQAIRLREMKNLISLSTTAKIIDQADLKKEIETTLYLSKLRNNQQVQSVSFIDFQHHSIYANSSL